MEIAILHVALIAKYFTTDKHFTYYLLSSEGWHFRRAKINQWGRCPIIDLVIVLVFVLGCLVLVLVLGLVNITGLGLKGQRSRLGLTAMQHGFELYRCLIVANCITVLMN